MIRIGIDVGGTNTDAVLMDGTRVLSGVKAPTSGDQPVASGTRSPIRTLRRPPRAGRTTRIRGAGRGGSGGRGRTARP